MDVLKYAGPTEPTGPSSRVIVPVSPRAAFESAGTRAGGAGGVKVAGAGAGAAGDICAAV